MALLSTTRIATSEKSERDTKNERNIDEQFPCTMLAGCGNVCIRRTAHRSTGSVWSFPADWSLQRTSRSLHKMPTRERGVSSGARHSTWMLVLSPTGLMTSKAIEDFRTTRVRCRGPSMINRLDAMSRLRQSYHESSIPMRLHKWTGELPSYSCLPLNQLSARLGLTFTFIHVVRQGRYLGQCTIHRIIKGIRIWGCTAY